MPIVTTGKKYFNNTRRTFSLVRLNCIQYMRTDKKAPQLTTAAENPIADNQNSITAGPRVPLLMQDHQLIEKLARQNRERILERTVHAKGSGAYRTLTITREIVQQRRSGAVKNKSLAIRS